MSRYVVPRDFSSGTVPQIFFLGPDYFVALSPGPGPNPGDLRLRDRDPDIVPGHWPIPALIFIIDFD